MTGGGVPRGREGRVDPLVRFGRNGVDMGVEEDRGEGGIRTRPCEEKERLVRCEFKGQGLKADGIGQGEEEGGGGGVLGIGRRCADTEVLLEVADLGFFIIGEGRGRGGDGNEE